ncbi:hypothetical protein KIPB_013833, partial [Kipferlia bialata]
SIPLEPVEGETCADLFTRIAGLVHLKQKRLRLTYMVEAEAEAKAEVKEVSIYMV